MSDNSRVIWTEGMFLRPHHYQQYTRYLENYIHQRADVARPLNWGFGQLQLDEQLLGLGKIGISRAHGIFQDGTPFAIPNEAEPPRVLDVPQLTKNQQVFLCIPLRRAGGRDLNHDQDQNSLTRYSTFEQSVEDNSTLGGTAADIQVSKLRLRLMLESEERSDYACLGIGRIIEVQADNSILLDSHYIPPVMDCQAHPSLVGFIRDLYGLMRHRAQMLATNINMSGRGGAAEISDFLMLQAINRQLPLMQHLASLNGYHPESLYQILVTIAGELASFTAGDRKAPEFDTYHQDDLQNTFKPVFESLRLSLSQVIEQAAIAISVVEKKFGIRVATLKDPTLVKSATFVLAIAADMPLEDLRKYLPNQIKVGPVEQIRQLVNVQLPGIRVRPLPVVPRQIPFHTGYVYFELDRHGELWSQLESSGGFAFHIGEEFPGLKLEFWAIRSN